MRKTAQIVIGLAISLLAFALAFKGAHLAEMVTALRKANYFYVVPAVALIWLGLYLRALTWSVILGGAVPYSRVYAALNEGYLLNNLLPFRLGEFARAYLISRGSRLTTAQALSSVLVERVIDLLMIMVLLAAFLPLVAGLDLVRNVAAVSVVLGLAALAGLVVLARQGDWVLRVARAVLARLRFSWLDPEAWEQRIEAFLHGLSMLRDARRAFWAAFWSGLAWIVAGLGAWMLLLAFVPAARPSMGFFVLTVLGLGSAAPSAPGAAGVFEASVVLALSILGVDRDVALGFALVFHAVQLGLTTVLGGLALAREGETIAHLVHAAQSVLQRARRPESVAVAHTPVDVSPEQ